MRSLNNCPALQMPSNGPLPNYTRTCSIIVFIGGRYLIMNQEALGVCHLQQHTQCRVAGMQPSEVSVIDAGIGLGARVIAAAVSIPSG